MRSDMRDHQEVIGINIKDMDQDLTRVIIKLLMVGIHTTTHLVSDNHLQEDNQQHSQEIQGMLTCLMMIKKHSKTETQILSNRLNEI